MIHYICEDNRQSRGLWRLLKPFSETRGLRFIVAGVGAAVMVVGLVFTELVILLFYFGQPNWVTFRSVLSIVATIMFLYREFGPLILVLWRRVVSAPGWLQGEDKDRLIEWRAPPKWPTKSVQLVRYSGECPLCRGRVLVKRRGWWHSDELVGRCEDAPRSHVFTFDHILRVGSRI